MFHTRKTHSSKDWKNTTKNVFVVFLFFVLFAPRSGSSNTTSKWVCQGNDCEAMRKKHVLVRPKSLLKISPSRGVLLFVPPQQGDTFLVLLLPYCRCDWRYWKAVTEQCHIGLLLYCCSLKLSFFFCLTYSWSASPPPPFPVCRFGMCTSLISSETTIVPRLHNCPTKSIASPRMNTFWRRRLLKSYCARFIQYCSFCAVLSCSLCSALFC